MPAAIPELNGNLTMPDAAPNLRSNLREFARSPTTCSVCIVKSQCMPRGLDQDELRVLDPLVTRRIRMHRGDTLFRAGEKFTSLFAIRSGSCKSVLPGEDGHYQVAGYHMAGDVLGTDGIAADHHDCEAIALEDMEVCVMPFDRIEILARQNPHFHLGLIRLLSREIARERHAMLVLGTMQADQRLATFLLDLAQRYHERGYSSVEFVLRMTREEIGSHLGLKLETISRLFSRFHEEGLIQVHGRVVKVLDRVALCKVVAHEHAEPRGDGNALRSRLARAPLVL
jgi:CRP/FNR family transcriptional regulator, anaerobic regulatory protein